MLRVHGYEPLREHLGRLAHRLARVAVDQASGVDLQGALREAWASFETGGKPFPAGTHDSALRMLNDLVAEGGGLALIHEAVVAAVLDSLVRDPGPRRRRSMTRDKANRKAMELAAADPEFVKGSEREWAERIGCSVGLVNRLPFWQKTMQRLGRGRPAAAPQVGADSQTPRVVRMTDAVLEGLTADHEPGPQGDDLPDRPRRFRPKKRR
jgi:hypothetical protein